MTDIVCHGVPSPGVFARHLGYIASKRGRRVVSYAHRPKNKGWGHNELFQLDGGMIEQSTPLADSWRNLFYDNKMLRPSCYSCPYTNLRRCSDLTIADFWGIERSSRPYLADALGVSLVLVNTDRGLGALTALNGVRLCPMSLEDALPGNPMLSQPSGFEGRREEPWEIAATEGYRAMVRGMGYHERESHWAKRRAVGKVKSIVKKAVGYEKRG